MIYKMNEFKGNEFKTGDVVRIQNAYFKNDNGLYFVEHSPGDPSWCGRDYCLRKVSKTGKPSTAKYNLCFWPISSCVSNYQKNVEARVWNRENATIENASVSNFVEIAATFAERADNMEQGIVRREWDFGKDNEWVKKDREIQKFYRAVAERVRKAG